MMRADDYDLDGESMGAVVWTAVVIVLGALAVALVLGSVAYLAVSRLLAAVGGW